MLILRSAPSAAFITRLHPATSRPILMALFCALPRTAWNGTRDAACITVRRDRFDIVTPYQFVGAYSPKRQRGDGVRRNRPRADAWGYSIPQASSRTSCVMRSCSALYEGD